MMPDHNDDRDNAMTRADAEEWCMLECINREDSGAADVAKRLGVAKASEQAIEHLLERLLDQGLLERDGISIRVGTTGTERLQSLLGQPSA
ncbi:MAG: hypothetical protein ACFCBV_06140 [Phycisphaerales bacterium]